MTSRVRIRLRPATAGRIIFFLVLYLIGLSFLPGLVQSRHAAAEAAACPQIGVSPPCTGTGLIRS
jgi:uncharacterized membrane protein